MKQSDKKYIIFFVIICLIIIIFTIERVYDQWELQKNSEFTEGKITDISYERRGKYYLHYEFFVKGKRYTGKTLTQVFGCFKKKNKCIGNQYSVAYSNQNPDNNDIGLGKDEEYKATIRFFKIDWKNGNGSD